VALRVSFHEKTAMTPHTLQRASALSREIQRSGPTPELCAELGELLERQEHYPGAAACYRQALETDPNNPNLAFRLANLLVRTGFYEEAAGRYRQVVRLEPQFPEAWFNLGVVDAMTGQTARALDCYRRAIALRPDYAEAHNNEAILLHALGRRDEARAAYSRSIKHSPRYGQARYNRALLDQEEDRLAEAAQGYRSLLAIEPGHAAAHNNLGNILLALNDAEAARESYQKAIDAEPQHAEAQWNRSFADLLLGDFARGWAGYEWRLRQPESRPRHLHLPRWQGEPLEGRHLLLWAEQGMGDTLQVIRLARRLMALGGRVTLECQRPLLPLLHSVSGIDAVIRMGEPPPVADLQLPVMSLPYTLGLTLNALPGPIPYLAAPSGRIEYWRERLRRPGDLRPTIGLAWAGNPGHRNDHRRSIPAELLTPLTALPLRWIAIQPDAADAPGVERFGNELADFGETAGLIENLDLVVTVDTSVAHLAGALACPVWTLLPYAPDFRWMLGRDDSPWYPTMRLFRQERRDDWAGVIAQVRSELASRFIP
jgi:tetratricopeptide (TPR) repeat protein